MRRKAKIGGRLIGLFLMINLMVMMVGGFAQATEKYGGMRFCSMGTSVPGGTSYPVGAAMAQLLTKNLDIAVTAEASGGSKENVVRLGRGEMDIGISNSPISRQAYKGIGIYEGEPKDIRALFTLYFQQAHIVVLEDSDIYHIADLAGHKVSVGTPGSGCENFANHVLTEYQLDDKVKKAYLGYSEATMAIKDGTIDAAFYPAMIPVAGVVELAATHDIRILPFEDVMVRRMHEKYGYYYRAYIPTGLYRGVDEDVPVIGFGIEMDCRADLPENLAYDIVKGIYENLEELRPAHKAITYMSLDIADKVAIPLHPGAEKYYKEVKGK